MDFLNVSSKTTFRKGNLDTKEGRQSLDDIFTKETEETFDVERIKTRHRNHKSKLKREHTTPVTTTWTSDFLTRQGEVRKSMEDWLHDKMIPWKARQSLLQTNSGTFPCESRLQKWGKQ